MLCCGNERAAEQTTIDSISSNKVESRACWEVLSIGEAVSTEEEQMVGHMIGITETKECKLLNS